jgi:hypothetical protein
VTEIRAHKFHASYEKFDSLTCEASCDFRYSTCMKRLRVHPRHFTRASELSSYKRPFKLGVHWIGSARLGSGERPRTASEAIAFRKQEAWKQVRFYWPSARFGLSERFALSTIPELFRYLPKGSVPGRAGPMQCAAFHLFPLSFISADCAVPIRADPDGSSARPALLSDTERQYQWVGEPQSQSRFRGE